MTQAKKYELTGGPQAAWKKKRKGFNEKVRRLAGPVKVRLVDPEELRKDPDLGRPRSARKD